MNKKILIALVAGIAVVSSMIYIFSKNDEKTVQSKELHQVADVNNIDSVKQISGAEDLLKKEVEPKINKQIEKVKTEQEKYTASVDMNKWQYNAQDGVFYQTGIVYTQIPANLKYQKMALFVPEKYMTCIKKTDTFFSCKKNVSEYIGKYNADKAPILFEINSPDFAATSALSEYKNYSKYIKAGIVYVHIGFRGIESGAPYGVTDIKAAVKYLRRNSEHIAGNVNSIFALGIREGGMLAAVLGASGNAKSYMPYLQKIGALKGVDDNINGVILFNPISGLDTANEALEWLLGEERKDMTDEQRKISETMAKEYANYVNKAGFIDANGRALTLQYSKKGIYKEGTYYDYIKNVIAKSLQNFIKTHSFPFAIPKSWEISEDKAIAQDNIRLWGTVQSREKFLGSLNSKKEWIFDMGVHGLKISSIKDFNHIFKRNIPQLSAFDGMNKEKNANLLFGMGNGDRMHFDFYTARVLKNSASGKDFSSDLYKQDEIGNITLKRTNLYNPLYYLIPSYEGYNTSTVAPYWYIRNGLFQNSDILTSAINLSIAIRGYRSVKDADYQTVWGMGEVKNLSDEDMAEIFKWISDKIK